MKLVFSHPTGNENVRAALGGLHAAGMLAEFNTSIACFPGSTLDKLGGIGPLAEIRRRSFDAGLKSITRMWPYKEGGRLLSARMGWQKLLAHESGKFCIDQVYHYIDHQTALGLKKAQQNGAAGVYAYEDAALQSFGQAKELGMDCYYDLPIGYWRAARRLLQTEAENRPEWGATLTGFKDSDAKLWQKDEELRLADRIFVASSFTASTLKDFPHALAPVHVVPYGFPEPRQDRVYDNPAGRKLKLLFVGGLSQRKGIASVFEAVDKLGKHVELTVVGRKTGTHCPALGAALARHRWIESMPHASVLELMSRHDVLLFPSLFEGFGLVITEAMAQGTPVITTNRTAGPDVITPGEDGWLVDAGSTDALLTCIEELLQKPALITEAGKAALRTAAQRPWKTYGAELAALVNGGKE